MTFDHFLEEAADLRESAEAALIFARATLEDPLADEEDRTAAQRLIDLGAEELAERLSSSEEERVSGRDDPVADDEAVVSVPLPASVAGDALPWYLAATDLSAATSGARGRLQELLGLLRGANAAAERRVVTAHTVMGENVVQVLMREGVIEDYRRERDSLVVELKDAPADRQRMAGVLQDAKLSQAKKVLWPHLRGAVTSVRLFDGTTITGRHEPDIIATVDEREVVLHIDFHADEQ